MVALKNHQISATRILLVEEDLEFANSVSEQLLSLPAEVVSATDGETGLALAENQAWAMVVLNVRLPKLSGLEVCQRLRHAKSDVPICLIANRSTEIDHIIGLEMGADDYLVKPVSLPELIARIRAILRRPRAMSVLPTQLKTADKTIRAGGLTLDAKSRRAHLGERLLDLTPREWDLLWLFAMHPGIAFTRSELLDKVWGLSHEGYEHTVNSHINRLRAKLNEPQEATFIQTVWGTGYRFESHP